MKNYKVKILSLKNLHDSGIKMSAMFFDEEERPQRRGLIGCTDDGLSNITKNIDFIIDAFTDVKPRLFI